MLRDISPLKQRDQELVTLTGRLIEAQEGERRRISRELHDDIGQQAAPLRRIYARCARRWRADRKNPPAALRTWFRNWLRIGDQHPQAVHDLHSSRCNIWGLLRR